MLTVTKTCHCCLDCTIWHYSSGGEGQACHWRHCLVVQPPPQRSCLICVPVLCQQDGLHKQHLQRAGLTSDSDVSTATQTAGRRMADLTKPYVHGTGMPGKQVLLRVVRCNT